MSDSRKTPSRTVTRRIAVPLLQRLLYLVLLVLASSAGAQNGFDEKNTVLVGDLNSDGLKDIYLKYTPQFALVGLDDLVVPIPTTRSRVAEFVLIQQANFQFTIQSSLTATQLGTARSWAQSAIEIILADLNIDFAGDAIIKNVASAIPGASDILLIGSATAGAAPVRVLYANNYYRAMVRDFVRGITNPAYFDSGRRSTCVSYPAASVPPVTDPGWFEGTKGEEEGSAYIGGEFDYRYNGYLWTIDFVTFVQCFDYIDTTLFNASAVDMIFYMAPYWENQGIQPQTNDANGLEALMEALFGGDFMRNVLSTGSTADYESLAPIIDTSDINNPNDEAEVIGNIRTGLIIWRLIKKLGLSTYCDVAGVDNQGNHFYSMIAPVCTVGSPGCTEENVYNRESRMHPAPGYWGNKDPVTDGQKGWATLGCSRAAGICDAFAVKDGGPIVFRVFGYSPGSGGEHWNETLPGHLFHPGKIERTVFTQANKVVIQTVGTGEGLCPKLNERQGKKLFILVDQFIECHLRGECRKQHQ
jgi:hypothetical protein